jgi:hypothetical protein
MSPMTSGVVKMRTYFDEVVIGGSLLLALTGAMILLIV